MEHQDEAWRATGATAGSEALPPAFDQAAYSAATAYLQRLQASRAKHAVASAGLPIGAPSRPGRVVPYWFGGGK
jgi:hypothetical protein